MKSLSPEMLSRMLQIDGSAEEDVMPEPEEEIMDSPQ
jgi:hypothetical protein